MFLGSWAGLGTVLGGGVPDRSLDYRRMLWFRIRVVPWLAHVLIDFGVRADSRIRTALWCGMRVLVFWCAIIAGHIISFERLVHG